MGRRRLGAAAPFITRDALAARQWEIVLSAAELARGAAAWPTPPVRSYRAWLEEWYSTGAAAGRRGLLSPAQAAALWRRVVAGTPESAQLLGPNGAADWAADAWRQLRQWQVDPAELRAAADQPDFRAFLRWASAYRAVLDGEDWLDPADLEHALAAARPPNAALVVCDPGERTPAELALFARLERDGVAIANEAPDAIVSTRRRIRLADGADELRTALAWARASAAAAPDARIAVVISGFAGRRVEIERAIAAERDSAPPIWIGGARLAAHPAIGAALTGIELCGPQATFATLSRWLRSAYFGPDDPAQRGQRALLEARLRDDVRAQLPFAEAWRGADLAATITAAAPTVGAALTAALTVTAPQRPATPGGWIRSWQRALTALGWRPERAADDAVLSGWQGALDDFARLTPVVGEIGAAEAAAELERGLERPAAAPLPVHGIHVLERIDDVGPGYTAVWVTGFTDAAWPEPARGNPLLPRALLRAHALPGATPREVRERCARRFARLATRVPSLIVSWPARVFDYETDPSPAIADWAELELERAQPAQPAPGARRRARTTVADTAPALEGERLPGGAGMLGRQARCPLRALCEDRLGARALSAPAIGLSDRQRGIVAHRAVELLLDGAASQAAVAARAGRVAASVEQALGATFGAARHALRAVFELESERLGEALHALLAEDARRAPFAVVAVERREELRLERWTLRVRLDRLDRLADETLAVIDYKTGARAGTGRWTAPRLDDAQVPLYVAAASEPVSAAVIAQLRGRGARYVGFWEGDAFPGRSSRLPAGRTWPQQVDDWRRQTVQLAAELAAGDTRIFIDDNKSLDELRGDYAPLSRIAEQLALARGTLQPW